MRQRQPPFLAFAACTTATRDEAGAGVDAGTADRRQHLHDALDADES
jgi:hypothetical protein